MSEQRGSRMPRAWLELRIIELQQQLADAREEIERLKELVPEPITFFPSYGGSTTTSFSWIIPSKEAGGE